MSTRRVGLAVEIWRIYCANGRPIPPTWAARAAGASPTAVLAAIRRHHPELIVRPGHNGRHWNWGRAIEAGRMLHMSTEKWISNGNVYETDSDESCYPEKFHTCASVAAQSDDGPGLDFAAAAMMAGDGFAVARCTHCGRIVFRQPGAEHLSVGVMDDKGICTAFGVYTPTVEDLLAKDWVLMMAAANAAAEAAAEP